MARVVETEERMPGLPRPRVHEFRLCSSHVRAKATEKDHPWQRLLPNIWGHLAVCQSAVAASIQEVRRCAHRASSGVHGRHQGT